MVITVTQAESQPKDKAILNWSIANYREGQFVSPYFSPPNSNTQLKLHLFAPSKLLDVIIFVSCNQPDLLVRLRISILDRSELKVGTKVFELIYCELSHLNFLNNLICKSHAINGTLRIYCEVDLLKSKAEILKQPTNKFLIDFENSGSQKGAILRDLQTLLESEDFSDVVLEVGGKEFKAHKAILSARSDVFKAMFVTDLEEKKRNRVEISDIEVEVFEHLLLYIYTDIIPELSQHTVDLFIAADKYNLSYLKSSCEQLLIEKPLIESAAHVLMIADLHNAVQLKAKYIQFINENSANVRKTEGWKHLIQARSDLLFELYLDISDKFRKLNINKN